jgi:hypothetical protein
LNSCMGLSHFPVAVSATFSSPSITTTSLT